MRKDSLYSVNHSAMSKVYLWLVVSLEVIFLRRRLRMCMQFKNIIIKGMYLSLISFLLPISFAEDSWPSLSLLS